MSTTTSPARRTPGELQSIWLVAEREIGSKLRSKAFVISTAILIVAALASVVWGGFAANNAAGGGTPVAVTSQTQSAVSGVDGLDVTVSDSDDAARALVEDGTVDAALVSAHRMPRSTTPSWSRTASPRRCCRCSARPRRCRCSTPAPERRTLCAT